MPEAGGPVGVPTVEAALRHLGALRRGRLDEVLVLAADRPDGSTGLALAPLLEPTSLLPGWNSEGRAHAILRLIEEGVHHRSVGPTTLSRRRAALQAALRLPAPNIEEDWGASLNDRFKQLQHLRSVFGGITTTQPVEMAWKRGVAALSAHLQRRFRELAALEDWEPYRKRPEDPSPDPTEWLSGFDRRLTQDDDVYRAHSPGAQPLFGDLLITTVYMSGRSVRRRVTERVVTARGERPVPYYIARGFSVGRTTPEAYAEIAALWGCRAELVTPERGGPRPVTRLHFPEPLQPGQQAHFASEAVFDPERAKEDDRDWIDVDIDHHGIPSGKLLYDGRLPVRGLTIRVVFEPSSVPAAVWWYAEANEDERYVQPPPGDRHRLPIVENAVTHTFTDGPCQPREHYGLAFGWSVADA